MKKVLFTHSYFYRYDPKQWKAAQPYPPLGTITAAAFLREHGYEVSLFDTNLAFGPNGLKKSLDQQAADVLVIYDDGFNYLTKMCLTNMREAAFKMIEIGKQRQMEVIVCSSDATDHSAEYLTRGADYIIKGEGELSLLELLQQGSGRNVAGLAYIENGEYVETSPRPVLRDLDSLPMAAWDLVDIEAYRKIWLDKHGYFALNLATTRGCPYKCNWCAKPIYGNRYNSRSPQKVVEEIQFLKEKYRPDYLWMCDDIFGLKPGWVQSFNQYLDEVGMRIPFKIQSRVDLLLKEDSIDALVNAGLDEVWLGAESGSQKILDAMDKGTRVPQIYEATSKLQQRGVKVGFFIQFGYPGETSEDIAKTLNLIRKACPDAIGVSVSYPLPGTVFYERVKEELSAKSNWTDSDDLDTMYQSPFPSSYYKALHRYVHKLFRRERARKQLRNAFRKSASVNYNELASGLYYEPAFLLHWFSLRLKKKTVSAHE